MTILLAFKIKDSIAQLVLDNIVNFPSYKITVLHPMDSHAIILLKDGILQEIK